MSVLTADERRRLAAEVSDRQLPPPEERRRIREAAGLSQADMARWLEVDATQIGRWETGLTRPRSGDRLRRYVALLRRLRDLTARAS